MKLNNQSECLLSLPGDVPPTKKIDRKSCVIKVNGKLNGQKSARQFSRQYCHSYSVRLWSVRPRLEEIAKSEWEGVEIKKIAELCEFSQARTNSTHGRNGSAHGSSNGTEEKGSRKSGDHGQHIAFRDGVTVAIIGTVFKYQPEKPSILQELAEENPMVPIVPKSKYISDRDTIQLEDETTRVHLVLMEECGMTVGKLVNGVICAVKGRPNINGKFEVTDILFPTPSPKPLMTIKMSIEMVFVSGIEFGCGKNALPADLLFDYLQGLAGCPLEVQDSIAKKTKVFFVGDTFLNSRTKGLKDQPGMANIASDIDEKLDQLAQTMDVLILPGINDPVKPMFPQSPIHRCVLPRVSRRPTFKALSNPARVEIPTSGEKNCLQLDIILSSGENVKDAVRNADTLDSLEMAQNLLRWGHLCPTAPDTLPLHPGVEDDVFIVDSLPHLFVIGNQDSFDALDWKNTKILTIPKFSETGSAVLLTSNLDVVPINFKSL